MKFGAYNQLLPNCRYAYDINLRGNVSSCDSQYLNLSNSLSLATKIINMLKIMMV